MDYLDVQLSARKLAVLRALAPDIDRVGRYFITEAGWTTLLVEADGSKDGKPAHVRATVSHADGYEITAIPMTAALLQ